MKYRIKDITLFDPELTSGEFDSPEQAIDHLAPTMDHLWPDEWFIRKNANRWRLGVYNTTETDSWGEVAIIEPAQPVASTQPKPEAKSPSAWVREAYDDYNAHTTALEPQRQHATEWLAERGRDAEGNPLNPEPRRLYRIADILLKDPALSGVGEHTLEEALDILRPRMDFRWPGRWLLRPVCEFIIVLAHEPGGEGDLREIAIIHPLDPDPEVALQALDDEDQTEPPCPECGCWH